MRPLLFIPFQGTTKPTFADVGLAEIERVIDRVPSTGPDGNQGFVCGWATPKDKDIRYDADKQLWLPASGIGGDAGRYWVGVWKDSQPTEEEVLRPDRRKSTFVELADGKRWLITRPIDMDRFPVPQADGSILWAVDEKFNDIVTRLDRIKAERIVTNGDQHSFLFDKDSDFILLCDILQINYRVTPELVSQLRLFSDNSIGKLVAAMFGFELA